MKVLFCYAFLGLFLLVSCAGYHTVDNRNPLLRYGVKSVSIPMFVNQTSFSGVSGAMTREISKVLHSYPGINVYAGEFVAADAVLIGVIKSGDKVISVIDSSTKKFTTDKLKDSIGNRREFYIPSASTYKLKLELTLIKDPSPLDKELIQSDLKKYLSRHPKIIFNEVMDLSGSFSRATLPNTTPDDGGVTNYTQNKALFEKSIESLAVSAAQSFKEVILNAF